ncbi:MAG: aspartate-semialdehyde dehydrogenase [Candidatus Baltobacteraceae bacterium]
MSALRVGIVGATGAVGETLLRVLEERRVPLAHLAAFGSRNRDAAVRYGGALLDVRSTTGEALADRDVVFFAGGESLGETFFTDLAARGIYCIDNNPTFRLRDDMPLIVPEINAEALEARHRILPVGNCTAIILALALAPIRDTAGLREVMLSTYQAASGAGRAGLEELDKGQRAVALGEREDPAVVFPAQLARNVIPQIGGFDADGWSGEERKVSAETKKMLGLPELAVSATCVRVPVRTAHAESIFVRTERPTTLAQLQAAFEAAPGLRFHREGIVTPRDVEGSDDVHVARLRADGEDGTRFALWCTGDQLRKGAATNAVQILELLIARGYLG